jgi:hypothetical protein
VYSVRIPHSPPNFAVYSEVPFIRGKYKTFFYFTQAFGGKTTHLFLYQLVLIQRYAKFARFANLA